MMKIACLLTLCVALVTQVGCFTQRAFPHQPGDVHYITPPANAEDSTRAWLRAAHEQLAHLLPEPHKETLLTEDLVDQSGAPIDAFDRLRENPQRVHSIWGNLNGVAHSAQATGADVHVETPAPQWAGFEWITIPIQDGLTLSGQFALARENGAPIRSTCIIILPGFFGDTGPLRSNDLAQLFLAHGFHVLGLEQRGAGQTEARHPNVPYTFGVLETGDLLAVAQWLQAKPEIDRTGAIGFCWGANHVLLAAWEDGRPEQTDEIHPRLLAIQRPWNGKRHFEAGVIAFSPTLRFEEFADSCEVPHSIWTNAIIDRFQGEVEQRQRRKGDPINGSLRDLVDREMMRSPLAYPEFVDDGFDYLRLLPYQNLPYFPKLRHARVPTLIVHAINDPMGNAQDIPDFIAETDNPHVAAVLLPGGGHLGFAPYAREYFYSLLINFFDAQRGAGAALAR